MNDAISLYSSSVPNLVNGEGGYHKIFIRILIKQKSLTLYIIIKYVPD